MLIDLTVEVTASIWQKAVTSEPVVSLDHLGTHFDVMNKVFPLEILERPGIVYDVSTVTGRDIGIDDIDITRIHPGMFVAFYTGFIEQVAYGTTEYFSDHPQLAEELIDSLLQRRISIIGLDFAGVRRGAEHSPKDQYCADRGVFIVENLCNLKSLLNDARSHHFTAHTYPIKFAAMSGLPCRVVGEL